MTSRNKGILTAVLCIVISLLPLAIGLILYNKLPEQLPIHYSIEGEADAFADKMLSISLLPGICAGLALILAIALHSFAEKSPKVFASVLLIWPLLSCSIQGMMLCEAFGFPVNDMTITMILMGIIFAGLGNVIPTVRPNGWVGVRFPWIMDDEDAWNKTQRFTGMLMVLLGILFLIEAFAMIGGTSGAIALLLWGTIILVVIAAIYSYAVSR